ncbi:MAG: glycosyltransferase [Candidatus Bathyarchaeales archaeon]
MPELLLHFAVPFSISAPIVGVRRATVVGIVGMLPDVDALLHVHRSMTHSLIILTIFSLLPLYVAFFKLNEKPLALFSFFSLTAHPIMDMFQTYTPILYPISSYSFQVNIKGNVLISQSVVPYVQSQIISTPTNFQKFLVMDAPIFTSEGFIVSLLLIATPVLFSFLKNSSSSLKNSSSASVNNLSIEVSGSRIKKEDLTVVIPTLNEVGAIGKVIDELRSEGYNNILVVDGYSKDGTVEVARSKNVSVVFQEGKGKADAIRTGIRLVKTPFLIVMDGDYTYDPKDIKKFLDFSEYDEVIGVREKENIPKVHRLGNWIITKTFNLLFGTRLRDVCSGMYLLRTEVAREIGFESKGFSVEVEVAAHVATTSRRIGEVNINYRKRIGDPKLKSFHGFSIILSVVRLMLRYNPVFFIFSASSAALIPGAAIVLYVVYELIFQGIKHHIWAIIGVSLSGVGFTSFLLAVLALYLKRLEYRIMERLKKS